MYSVLLRAVLFCIAFRDPSGFQFENCYNYCETHCEFHHLFNCFPYLPYSVALGNCVERYTPLPPTSLIFLQKPIILVHDRFMFFCLLHRSLRSGKSEDATNFAKHARVSMFDLTVCGRRNFVRVMTHVSLSETE